MHLYDLSATLVPAVKTCFKRVRNCLLHNITPLERRINFNEEQCINFCGQHSNCSSASFSKSMAICDIYNRKNGSEGAQLVHHYDFQYYEPKLGNGSRTISQCWQENAPSNMPKLAEMPSAVLVDSSDFTSKLDTSSPNSVSAKDELSSAGSPHSPVQQVPKDSCAGEKDVIVFKSTGYRLRLSHNSTLNGSGNSSYSGTSASNNINNSSAIASPLQQASSETECIFSCLINLARGRSPYECVAATYNVQEGQCLLYGSGNDLDGNVHLIPDASHNHYEKGCILMDLVELCKGYPVVRYPQKTLLGFAISSKLASSFIECIEMCFIDRQLATANRSAGGDQLTCKSIMFFYEENNTNNCILNSESRETAPAFFVDENEALVDYASFDNCYGIDEPAIPTSPAPPQEQESKRRAPASASPSYTISDERNCTNSRNGWQPPLPPKAVPLPEQFRPGGLANGVLGLGTTIYPPLLGVLPGLLRVDSDRLVDQQQQKNSRMHTRRKHSHLTHKLRKSMRKIMR